jgi:hypothetical protein
MEADAVVERWTSPDELVWYMRFASGWIIQGGFVYTNNESTNVTLPVPFSSSNYTAVAINYINGSAANYNPAISFMSETELTWSAAIGSKAMSFGYIAMGMGAQ